EDRRRAARVVVRARLLVAEVAAVDDLARGRIGAGDDGRDDLEARRLHARVHAGVQANRLARREARAEGPRLPERAQERERVLEVVGRQVPPPDVVRVVAAPAGRLVRLVAEDARGAALLDRLLVHRRDAAIREHDLAGDVLAGVVGVRRPLANVDE